MLSLIFALSFTRFLGLWPEYPGMFLKLGQAILYKFSEIFSFRKVVLVSLPFACSAATPKCMLLAGM